MNPSTASRQARARHPIAVVAERTGLSQDVLRIWERRYGAVQPQRGPDGKRLYSDADIDRLGLMHAATRGGRSVGQVARLSTDAIAALVEEDAEARERRVPVTREISDAEDAIEDAILLTRSLDASRLDARLRRAESLMGVAVFLESVAAPLLHRVGDEWHAGRLTPAQEHLASSVLHDMAMQTMRTFTSRNGAARLLVATPAGDRHAIGAALVGALAAVQGWDVIYLGADLPSGEIAGAARAANVQLVAVSVVYIDDRERVLGELRALRSQLPKDVPLVAGGSGAARLASELAATGIRVESSLADWTAELRAQLADQQGGDE
jgi:DNA-binding transcriptional MerR regulator/methylmalonyl-CoA mutase cobalamin-binding subunit